MTKVYTVKPDPSHDQKELGCKDAVELMRWHADAVKNLGNEANIGVHAPSAGKYLGDTAYRAAEVCSAATIGNKSYAHEIAGVMTFAKCIGGAKDVDGVDGCVATYQGKPSVRTK